MSAGAGVLFNSLEFALFLPVVLGLYWLLPLRGQNVLLLLASYVFYGAWDARFLSLIFISTLVDFVVGKKLGTVSDDRRRRTWFLASVVCQLGMLAFFKYFGFFVDSAVRLVSWVGLDVHPPLFEVLLPVGISFYTFQTMSYIFDVYRRRIEPTSDFVTFATFVAYFPQLVAGPIERARNLLPQIEDERRRPDGDAVRSGLLLMLVGLFKKVAVADAVAPFVADAFSGDAGRGMLLLGMLAFSLQIYGDFAGYTDIARGASRLFGIELMRNFRQPYLARSITEFWRTWHISLSAWLHDYLYVPLGGNKRGRLATYRNLVLTMLLGGLWHGANWTFVVWGGLHGLLLAGHRLLGGYVPRDKLSPLRWRDAPAILLTFASVTVLWIFFRADSMGAALDYLGGLATRPWGVVDFDAAVIVLFSAAAVLLLDLAQRLTDDDVVILRWPAAVRGASVALLVVAIAVWTGGTAQPFIYFQF
ncbi:MAG TPA: MBOAT family O-acyltransferase [Actinomycetota bacterium]|nr:MBOAT family O-acyltransferase [Actinomycetota bacterium]